MAKANPKLTAPQAVNTPTDEAYTPQVSRRADRGVPPPNLPQNPEFMLRFHPERFTVMCGRVIPSFAKFQLKAGVNGITLDREKRPRIDEAVIDQAKRGYKLLPFDVDGPGTSYIRRPIGTAGVHLLKFEQCFSGASHIACDEEGYSTWAASLVERGIVPPPAAYVLEKLMKQRQDEAEQLADKPGASGKLRRLQSEIDVLESALAETRRREGPVPTEEVSRA